jgi:hypothetical protein
MTLNLNVAEWVKSVAAKHLGANIRRYSWSKYLGEVHHNALGGISFLRPCEGKVVDANEEVTLVKISASTFCVVSNGLLSKPVTLGDKIAMSFYKLKRFDGSAADGTDDPSLDGCIRMTLTGTETYFPVNWEGRYLGINERFADGYQVIRNPYLQDLIQQMEKISVNGGLRKVVNVLVDANATDLKFNDPEEERSMEDRPAISVRVNTSKHVGMVEIIYNRVPDTYSIKLTPDVGNETMLEDLYFDDLGTALIDGIDDGAWKLANVEILKQAPKKRVQKLSETA